MKIRIAILVTLLLALSSCRAEEIPPKVNGAHSTSPPPVGLEKNPARPQSERPTPPNP